MKYYLIAGEASGDLHGSNLMNALKEKDAAAEFRFWGGDKMASVGGTPVKHIRELAFMGFKEVILNLPTIFRLMKECKKDIIEWQPNVVILIDYPGFNLRMAEFAKRNTIRTVFYISPQVWAWKANRVKKIRQYVDRMLVILPFEQQWYLERQYKVEFVGHPLLDVVHDFVPDPGFKKVHKLDERPIVALLPGSRKQEIALMLPIMLKAAKKLHKVQPVIAGAPSIPAGFYANFFVNGQVPVVFNNTYNLFSYASAGMVTSGTATLEAALFNMPEVVCYKGGSFSFWLAKRLVKVKFISLVNIIMDRQVVKELIQQDLTPKNLADEVGLLLNNEQKRQQVLGDYSKLQELLSTSKGASAKAAESIVKFLKSTQ